MNPHITELINERHNELNIQKFRLWLMQADIKYIEACISYYEEKETTELTTIKIDLLWNQYRILDKSHPHRSSDNGQNQRESK